jgi:SAM-dependent methyltransferase
MQQNRLLILLLKSFLRVADWTSLVINPTGLFGSTGSSATTAADVAALDRFIKELAKISAPKVVELGTRRQEGGENTRHGVWVPHAEQYIGVDYQSGEDVDLVADIHELSGHLLRDHFDAVISCSTLEHVKYPWIAAVEIAKVLKPGGFVFIQTCQTYALHSHPHDYWRFSTEGLETLFSPAIGFDILSCHYQYRCRILTPQEPHHFFFQNYLNVCLLAKKVSPAPEAFIPDFHN